MVMLPRTSRLRVVAGATVIYLVASITPNVAGQTGAANPAVNPPESALGELDCPPFGRRMPPDEILLTMTTDRLPRYHEFNTYPGEGRAMRASNDDLSVWFSVHFFWGVYPLNLRSADCWIDSIIRDGFLTPLGGQIYRWTGEDLMLRRISNHPLARPPEDCIGLFHLPMSSKRHSLGISGSSRLSLVALQVKRGDPELNEADSVLFDIDPGSSEEGGFLFGPCREPNKPRRHPHWIRTGQFIETCQWRVKVLRVVHPDEKSKIDGWVDLRVEPSTQATERPPAPHLPQDFDIPDDPDIPDEPDGTDAGM